MARTRLPKRPPSDEDGIRTTLYFSRAQHRALKLEAAERGVTMTQVLIEALQARHQLVYFTQRAVARETEPAK